MIYLLSMLFLVSSVSFADVEMDKLKEIQAKMNSNMDTYCSKGVVSACNAKNKMNGTAPAQAPQGIPQQISAADKAELVEMSNKMKACGEDRACLQKIAQENIEKNIASKEAKCRRGSQEDCFWSEHLKAIRDMQNLIK
jgi:hypothetical protein